MDIRERRKLYAGTTVIVVLFVLDRIFKYAVVAGSENIFPTVIRNTGIALSIGLPQPVLWIAVWCGMVVLGVMVLRAVKRREVLASLLLAGALLGAVSNIIDRMWWGGVVDYIYVGNWFPVFNIADVMIAGSISLWMLVI